VIKYLKIYAINSKDILLSINHLMKIEIDDLIKIV